MELPTTLVPALADLARRAGAHRLVLFGSRARGDCRERSDIDLAIYGLSRDAAGRLRLELEELPTLLRFDLVAVEPDTSPALLAEIQRDGVILYDEQAT